MARAPSFSASAISAATRAREAGSLVRASGETAGEGLLGRGGIPREHPLLGAQELIVVVLRRRFGREIRIDARGIGVLALRRQLLRTLLILKGARHRLDQAAAGGEQRERRVPPQSTGRGRRRITVIRCIIMRKREQCRSALRGGDTDRQSRRSRSAGARDAAECCADRRRGYPAYGRAAEAFRHPHRR